LPTDKICDQVSDAILDACLKEDKFSKVACETAAKTGMIMVLGEITTGAKLDYQRIIRETIKKIGYDDSAKGKNNLFFFVENWRSLRECDFCRHCPRDCPSWSFFFADSDAAVTSLFFNERF